MPTKTTTVLGARLSEQLVRDIGDLIRPLMIPHLQMWVTSYESHGAGFESNIAGLRKLIDEGGRWVVYMSKLVDENGVEYGSGGEAELRLLANASAARLSVQSSYGTNVPIVHLTQTPQSVTLSVEALDKDVLELHSQIESMLKASVVEAPAPAVVPSVARVFIGHGGDAQWEPIQEAVRQAGHEVEVFEADVRAGYSTLQVVLGMIRRSDVALIVMTGADELKDHSKIPRSNVVHELGLAQGLLGFENTVVLLEQGTTYPSNIDGHIQIRFVKGALHRAIPDVLRAIEQRVSV